MATCLRTLSRRVHHLTGYMLRTRMLASPPSSGLQAIAGRSGCHSKHLSELPAASTRHGASSRTSTPKRCQLHAVWRAAASTWVAGEGSAGAKWQRAGSWVTRRAADLELGATRRHLAALAGALQAGSQRRWPDLLGPRGRRSARQCAVHRAMILRQIRQNFTSWEASNGGLRHRAHLEDYIETSLYCTCRSRCYWFEKVESDADHIAQLQSTQGSNIRRKVACANDGHIQSSHGCSTQAGLQHRGELCGPDQLRSVVPVSATQLRY